MLIFETKNCMDTCIVLLHIRSRNILLYLMRDFDMDIGILKCQRLVGLVVPRAFPTIHMLFIEVMGGIFVWLRFSLLIMMKCILLILSESYLLRSLLIHLWFSLLLIDLYFILCIFYAVTFYCYYTTFATVIAFCNF